MSTVETRTPAGIPAAVPVDLPRRARRAKIICTIGPSSNTEAQLRGLMRMGMDVARLNFSHGTHDDHAKVIDRLRRAAEKEGRSVCILQDLQGPKIRTGKLQGRTPVLLKAGSRVTITPREIMGTAALLATTYKTLATDLQVGGRVLLADGLIELRVRAMQGDDIECDIINGGLLGENKGINLPGAALSTPSLTEKDYKDLEFGLKHGVDVVAISFVRTAEDVRAAKRCIAEWGAAVPVVAKLEKPQAIEHLEEILDVADVVMVARGDLGVELPPERVPVIQKHVIRRAAHWRKPVIIATQMLESMIENPRPTRAEASDVANAVFDGADAVMLSAESASGKYPMEAVSMMDKIVREAESSWHDMLQPHRHRSGRKQTIAETICESISIAAGDLQMAAIATFTETGHSARLMSKYRPATEIYAFAHTPTICNRMNLLWGVRPMLREKTKTSEEMVRQAEAELVRLGKVKAGDILGVVAGTRLATGGTNFMRFHVVAPETVTELERKARQKLATTEKHSK